MIQPHPHFASESSIQSGSADCNATAHWHDCQRESTSQLGRHKRDPLLCFSGRSLAGLLGMGYLLPNPDLCLNQILAALNSRHRLTRYPNLEVTHRGRVVVHLHRIQAS